MVAAAARHPSPELPEPVQAAGGGGGSRLVRRSARLLSSPTRLYRRAAPLRKDLTHPSAFATRGRPRAVVVSEPAGGEQCRTRG